MNVMMLRPAECMLMKRHLPAAFLGQRYAAARAADINLSSSAHRSVLRGTVVRVKYRGRYRLRKVLETYREPQSGKLLLHLHVSDRRCPCCSTTVQQP